MSTKKEYQRASENIQKTLKSLKTSSKLKKTSPPSEKKPKDSTVTGAL